MEIETSGKGHIEGLGDTAVRKLRAYGIREVETLATASPHQLMDYLAIPLDTAKDYRRKAYKLLLDNGLIDNTFLTGRELLEERKNLNRLSTGSASIDNLMGGGMIQKAIIEFYGEEGCGKTQIAHTATVLQTQESEKWKSPGMTLYIDTEGTFKPERIVEIATARGIDVDTVIDSVWIKKIRESTELELFIGDQDNDSLGASIANKNVRFIVVDSIIALHRAEYIGRGMLADRQQKLARIMAKLGRIADVHKLPVLINNQVMADPGMMFGDPTKPTGGHIIGHSSQYRFYLRKFGVKRSACMKKSSGDAEVTVQFSVSDKGVTDQIEEKKAAKKTAGLEADYGLHT